MRRSFNLGSLALFLIMSIWMTVQGCRSVATPTFPATSTPTATNTQPAPTNTRTFTPTFTNTGTNTNTRTPTNTPTVTNTYTYTNTPGGPTDTFTDTPTNTNTFTITFTPTVTYTFTDTNTPGGATNTPTACSPVFQATYTFASDIQCWKAWGSVTGTVQQDTVNVYTAGGSTGSLEVILPFSTTSQQEQIGIQFPSPGVTIATGSTISMYVMASNNGNAMQIFDQSGTGASLWDGGGWTNAGGYTASTWFQVQYTVNPGAPTSMIQFGLQVPSGTGAGQSNGLPVTVWIDAVTITPPPPTATPTNTPTGPTPTPTHTPPPGLGWNYDDSTVQGWVTVGSTGIPTSAAVTAFGYNSTPDSLLISLPVTISTSTNDFRVECNKSGSSTVFGGTNMDWVNMGIVSVTVNYYVSAIIGDYASTLYPYVIAGAGPTTYGGTYTGSWTDTCQSQGGCPYVNASAWHSITFTPSGGNWATDETTVSGVGVDINLNAPATLTGAYYLIDNITLQ